MGRRVTSVIKLNHTLLNPERNLIRNLLRVQKPEIVWFSDNYCGEPIVFK